MVTRKPQAAPIEYLTVRRSTKALRNTESWTVKGTKRTVRVELHNNRWVLEDLVSELQTKSEGLEDWEFRIDIEDTYGDSYLARYVEGWREMDQEELRLVAAARAEVDATKKRIQEEQEAYELQQYEKLQAKYGTK